MFMPSASLRLTHQVKFKQQFVEDALEELAVAAAVALFVDLVDAPRRPGVDRGIHVSESPFVGRELAVGMHVPLAQHEHELLFGEIRIDQGQGTQWKARSHAAYQGYSHLSGMEMTSAL
jgi:hypothetical protein